MCKGETRLHKRLERGEYAWFIRAMRKLPSLFSGYTHYWSVQAGYSPSFSSGFTTQLSGKTRAERGGNHIFNAIKCDENA